MRTWLKQFLVPALSTVLLLTIACFATIWVRDAGLLRPAEFQIYDRWMNERPTARQEDSPCLIVGMSEADIARFDFPISDRVMTDLLKKLLAAEPAAIGLDIYRDKALPKDDQQSRRNFLALVHANEFIIVPTKLSENVDTVVRPPETFAATPSNVHPQVAIININYDPDGTVRRGLLYRAFNTKTQASVPSLGFSLANIYVQSPFFNRASQGAFDASDPAADFLKFIHDRVTQHVKDVGPYHGGNIDVTGYPFLLDFRGPRDFTQETISRVMDGDVKPKDIKGRVVIVAVCAPSSKDYVRSPLQVGDADEFGAEHHARVVDQLVRAARGEIVSMRFWSPRAEFAWIFLFCALGSAVGWSARPPGRLFAGATGVLIAATAGALVLAGLWIGAHSVFRDNLWIPVVPPAMGFILATGLVTLYNAVTGRRDRSAMLQLIGHYVSDDVAKHIWAERDQVFSKGRLRTRRLRGTVLFTDLKGFSTISEQMKAQDLMRWLNQYFQGLSDLVKQSGGIIMKFNGDQIVAVFGPPRKRTLEECGVDARNAVRCAMRMRQRLTKLNARWARHNKPQAQMRIGIHTGWLVAGTLGSRQRMEWTVIGDTVNIAARLESVKKDLMPDDIAANGCRILISEATAKMLDLSFDIRPLGRLPLKGKRRRVLVHGVKGFVMVKRAAASVATIANISRKKD